MPQFSVRSVVSARSVLLFAALVALPVGARASNASFDGGSGCSDPPIISDIFTVGPLTSSGGACKHFGNHTDHTFNRLQFTTTLPNKNLGIDPFLCSADPWFLSCDFVVDGTKFPSGAMITTGNTITVEFFGIDPPGVGTHHGIPPLPPGTDLTIDNFFLNLNNPVCVGGTCRPPPNADPGDGDWVTHGVGNTFTAAANVPEPATWLLLAGGLAVLLARVQLCRFTDR